MVQVFLGTDSTQFEWKTEFNPERDYSKGWWYEKDGQLHFTHGKQGHFIYQQLRQVIEEHFGNWVFEYMVTHVDNKGGK